MHPREERAGKTAQRGWQNARSWKTNGSQADKSRMNAVEIICAKECRQRRPLTHCWSASSSARLELWLHEGIKMGGVGGNAPEVIGVEGGHLGPYFSYLFLPHKPLKTSCLKTTAIIDYLTVLQSWGMFHRCSMRHGLVWLHRGRRIQDPHSHVWCFS